jgi:hypothetical protein
MSVNVYRVEFAVHKVAAGGAAGAADSYRRTPRIALVQAASAHPKDILVPLNNNVTLGSGESFDIISVKQEVQGGEGSGVWQ